jgi:thimet oligopeptidase
MRSPPLRRGLAAFLSLAALAACGPPAEEPVVPQAPASSAQPVAAPAAAVAAGPDPSIPDDDPIPSGLSVDGEKRICDDNLKAAEALAARIRSLKGAPASILTYDATLGRFDRIAQMIAEAGQLPYLMAVAHPDAAVREAAKLCETKTTKFTTALYFDVDVAAVLRAYAEKKEPLNGEKTRLLTETLRDFRRNGLELPADKQEQLRRMNDDISKIGQDFESNIAAAAGRVELRPAQLKGLPADYIAKHAPNKDGKVEITTDYPDYFPFVTYAEDRKAALELYVAFTNRGGDENVQLLERLLKLRSEKAKLLGYPTWADYAIEPRMAQTSKAVRAFLAEVRDAVKEPARAELKELMKVHVRTGGKATDKLAPPDRYYLEDRVRAEKFKFDSKEAASYFEVATVIRGLLDITAKMYGLEYRAVQAPVWHPDVAAYDVLSQGKRIGRIYLDLYSREGKYKHAAMFPIRTSDREPDGRYLMPIAALECNFPKPGAQPALMSHEDVVTFFHEFGHVLHHVLSRSELATYAGTNTVKDFVEAPSQMFEEWPWSREVLDLFARHHKTGAKIPDGLWKAMTAARTFGRALDTQRQIFLATLDQELHTRDPGGLDSTRVVEEVEDATDSFAYVKGTHFQSSFGHLIGYDAGYYSYQWALALSRDVLTRFRKEGLLNPATAASWREEVLSKGGGADERSMVKAFLGREPNNLAYFAYLRGGE